MTKNLFISLIFLQMTVCYTASANKPESSSRSTLLISHNPVRLANLPNILVLWRTDAGNALGLDFRYVRSGENLRGYGAAATYRLYPFTNDFTGFYAEPFLAAHSIKDKQSSDILYSFGFVPGWQFAIKKKLALGIGFGFEYFTSDALIQAQQGANVGNATTFNPYMRVDIGWIF